MAKIMSIHVSMVTLKPIYVTHKNINMLNILIIITCEVQPCDPPSSCAALAALALVSSMLSGFCL